MILSRLTPCTSCARHVRGEDVCPFCGAAITHATEPAPRVIDERVSRGVLHALVGTATIVGAAVALGGCIMAVPHYGGAVEDAVVAPDAGP